MSSSSMPKRSAKEFALVVITLALLTAQPSVDMLVHPERGVDARRVDPELGTLLIRRITIALLIGANAVGDLADDARMDAEDRARRSKRAIEIAIDPVEHGLEGPLGAALGIGAIGGFLLDGVRDKRMRGLKKERAAASDAAQLLAIDAPEHRARTEEPVLGVLNPRADRLKRALEAIAIDNIGAIRDRVRLEPGRAGGDGGGVLLDGALEHGVALFESIGAE